MKLKKTLVLVLAACFAMSIFAGTAMAQTTEPVPSVNPGDIITQITGALSSARLVEQGEAVGQITDTAGNTIWIIRNLDTPFTGWQKYNDMWTYYKDGVLQHHWQYIDGKWYYFNEYGIMISNGVAWIENRLYYFDKSGACDTTPGWKKFEQYYYIYNFSAGTSYQYAPGVGYAWVYLNAGGYIDTGWQYIDGYWYMCDKNRGTMLCQEWYRDDAGYDYYFNANAQMVTGWQSVAETVSVGTPYSFDKAGTLKTGNTHTYYFAPNGTLQTGWQFIDGNWYYLDPYRMENTWAQIDCDPDPAVEAKFWFLFDENGIMQTGWKAVKTGDYMYYDPDNYTWRTEEEKKTADKDAAAKWTKVEQELWYYMTDWGNMVTGLQYINGNWYYFAPAQPNYKGGELQYVWTYGVGDDGGTWQDVDSWYYQSIMLAGQTKTEVKDGVPGETIR